MHGGEIVPSPKRAYWFRPARFWKWFAAYYPVTAQGWTVTVLAVAIIYWLVDFANRMSHSASDAIYLAAPWILAVVLIFDLITLKTGEYPSWWRRRFRQPLGPIS